MPIVEVTGLSNEEFLERYAAPARVGLAGGSALIDRTIRKMQRRIIEERARSLWSHAFLCSGRRIDGRIDGRRQPQQRHPHLRAASSNETPATSPRRPSRLAARVG